jgi:hypothetical protein
MTCIQCSSIHLFYVPLSPLTLLLVEVSAARRLNVVINVDATAAAAMIVNDPP